MGKLRSYQIDGVEAILRFLSNRRCAFLGDEMGLGKTAQALEATRRVFENSDHKRSLLVICPASLRLNWVREAQEWAGIELIPVFSRKEFEQKFLRSQHLVISYDLASDEVISRDLESRNWGMVIFDEAHYLKNSTALRTRKCFGRLWEVCDYHILLSGTPLPNEVIDGYTLFNRCAPDLFRSKRHFGYRYTNPTRNWYTGYMEYKGGKNLKQLRRILDDNFFIRRLKRKVATELPPKIFTKVPLRIEGASTDKEFLLSPEQAEALEASLAGASSLASSPEIATKRRALGMRKVPAVVQYVKEMMDVRDKVVLFAFHRDVIAALEVLLSEYKPAVIHGGVEGIDRETAVHNFQAGDCRLFLGQITAAGTGLTLTAASLCLFAELDWTPANMAQAIDRLHRIGQTEKVEVHYLLAENSMDQQIIENLSEKINAISVAMG
ncbi:MAG: DEAD/DEAH box helicase [Hyphomicrobiaceae bacterium]|nr:MAG: DEAD/DEAH box helicase [Hyphomicrobiaceae bacterium]